MKVNMQDLVVFVTLLGSSIYALTIHEHAASILYGAMAALAGFVGLIR